MLAITYSRASCGIDAPLITVETHLSRGMPGFQIVGLPETAVKESKVRVRSAIIHSNFSFPISRIIVNLAPADLPKEGCRFDLPIALGILIASKQVNAKNIDEYELAGELSLSGELRPIRGMLPFALSTSQNDNKKIIVPLGNAIEASLPQRCEVYPAKHLLDVCAHFSNATMLVQHQTQKNVFNSPKYPDLKDVKGQQQVKYALELAAAGGHSLLMSGPPGAGKTMLANRLVSILPELTEEQALEVAAIYSISNNPFDFRCWRERPFRNPHHTASYTAIVGGGKKAHPGEITLAHHGILFLDELPEFNRQTLEALREPLESKKIVVSRTRYKVKFPANFQLIAAMNPCPCGHFGNASKDCRCTFSQIQRYHQRISGPIMDRIDLHVAVSPLSTHALFNENSQTESSAAVKKRVIIAQQIQIQRQTLLNHALSHSMIKKYCFLQPKEQRLLQESIEKLGLSARAYHRILKIGRTIADLDQSNHIKEHHIAKALSFRFRDISDINR